MIETTLNAISLLILCVILYRLVITTSNLDTRLNTLEKSAWEAKYYPQPQDFSHNNTEFDNDYEDSSSKQRQANEQPCWPDDLTFTQQNNA